MSMENAVSTMMSNLPNLAVALLALWWASQRIDKLLDNQSKLIDQLIELMREHRRAMNGYAVERSADPRDPADPA
jgi:hypothetical protein